MKKTLFLTTILLTLILSCDIGSSSDSGNSLPTYTISYNANGGTGTMPSQSFEQDSSVKLTANTFTKDGFKFTGWSTEQGGSSNIIPDEAVYSASNSNITLYAQWGDLEFITKWQVETAESNTLQFPLDPNGTYDFTIDWGDGTPLEHITTTSTNNYIEHTYSTNGTYVVSIKGICKGFGYYQFFHNGRGAKGSLIDVLEWGEVQLHNNGGQFMHCPKLVTFSAKDTPDITNLTTLDYMFYSATLFNSDLPKWDVSHITSMYYTFWGAADFNGDISQWETGNVNNMGYMFAGAESFNGNISKWNTINVTSMQSMFFNATSFNGDISQWITDNVTIMNSMFNNAISFNGNISKWKTEKVTDMSYIFFSAIAFNCGNIDISTWNWSTAQLNRAPQAFDGSPLQSNPPNWYIMFNM